MPTEVSISSIVHAKSFARRLAAKRDSKVGTHVLVSISVPALSTSETIVLQISESSSELR